MKAYKYRVITIEPVHNLEKTINEIYLYTVGVCINDMGYVFEHDHPRSEDYEEIEIDYNDYTDISNMIYAQKRIDDIVEKLF